jgi:hypothetical protein
MTQMYVIVVFLIHDIRAFIRDIRGSNPIAQNSLLRFFVRVNIAQAHP